MFLIIVNKKKGEKRERKKKKKKREKEKKKKRKRERKKKTKKRKRKKEKKRRDYLIISLFFLWFISFVFKHRRHLKVQFIEFPEDSYEGSKRYQPEELTVKLL